LTVAAQSEILRAAATNSRVLDPAQRRRAPNPAWQTLSASPESQPSHDRTRLLDLVHGYRTTCIIAAALDLGVVDALREAPVAEDVLAERIGADPPSLRRLLHGMATLGLVAGDPRGFALTAMGRLLTDAEEGIRERAVLAGREYVPAWCALAHGVATGETPFDHVFAMSAWEHRRRNPVLNDCLNRTMLDDQRRTGGAVAKAYDFSRCRLVVDVGGGQGALLAEILAAYPQARGIVFDQPHVVAAAAEVLNAAGVAARCRVEGGSFFESVPAGGDTYLLQHVLHDWNDERCAAILAHCRAAMGAGSVLLVIENVLPEDAAPGAHLAMLDLHMMVMLGGRERTRGEYESLLHFARFEVTGTMAARGTIEVLEAKPA
jgi:hypothetical protein